MALNFRIHAVSNKIELLSREKAEKGEMLHVCQKTIGRWQSIVRQSPAFSNKYLGSPGLLVFIALYASPSLCARIFSSPGWPAKKNLFFYGWPLMLLGRGFVPPEMASSINEPRFCLTGEIDASPITTPMTKKTVIYSTFQHSLGIYPRPTLQFA